MPPITPPATAPVFDRTGAEEVSPAVVGAALPVTEKELEGPIRPFGEEPSSESGVLYLS
jgi:hypothetical protein